MTCGIIFISVPIGTGILDLRIYLLLVTIGAGILDLLFYLHHGDYRGGDVTQ